MDLLADVLAVAGVRGTLAARIEAAENWAVSWADVADAVFYAVTRGTAWLTLPAAPARRLMPGDIVLLPTGAAHTLSSEPTRPGASCDLAAAEAARRSGDVLSLGAGEVQTHILAAAYRHDPAVSTQVLRLLPRVVHLHPGDGGDGLDDTVRLVARELSRPQIASGVVLDRLVDVLLVHALRAWLLEQPERPQACWLNALSNPLMTAALTRLHEEPARGWTTDSLAAELAVSRATLSRRFQAVVGQAPGAYLTQWRMDLAARRLRDTDDPLETIARSVGYTSVYAFSRAFSRDRSQAPGHYRTAARQHGPTAAPPDPASDHDPRRP